MSIVVVQHIKTTWTKASRGGQGAVKRNAVPEAAKIPVEKVEGNSTTLIQHSLGYGERDDFAMPHESIKIDPTLRPFIFGCVEVKILLNVVHAEFRYSRGCAGAPERGWSRKTLHITWNEWGQIVYNGRFVGEGEWWYEKHVINVGLFKQVTPSVFTREAPTYRFDASAHLF